MKAYTDMYLPVLGDGQDGNVTTLPPMREIEITKTSDGSKGIHGVIDGVQVTVRTDRVYKDKNRSPLQKKKIIETLKSL